MSDDLTDMILSGLKSDTVDIEMGLRIEACLQELKDRERQQLLLYASDISPDAKKFIEGFMGDLGLIDTTSFRRVPVLQLHVNDGPIPKGESRRRPNLRVVTCETNYYQFPSSPYKP